MEFHNISNNQNIFYYERVSEQERQKKERIRNYYKKQLRRYLKKILSKRQYEVYMLRKKGLMHKEIAENMDIKENTSKSHLKEAIRKINSYLEKKTKNEINSSKKKPESLVNTISLTLQEKKIIKMRKKGKTYAQIAEKLGIQIDTVAKHIYNAKKKL